LYGLGGGCCIIDTECLHITEKRKQAAEREARNISNPKRARERRAREPEIEPRSAAEACERSVLKKAATKGFSANPKVLRSMFQEEEEENDDDDEEQLATSDRSVRQPQQQLLVAKKSTQQQQQQQQQQRLALNESLEDAEDYVQDEADDEVVASIRKEEYAEDEYDDEYDEE